VEQVHHEVSLQYSNLRQYQASEFRNHHRIFPNRDIPYKTLFFSRDKYPDAQHGFLNLYYKKWSKMAISEALNFLRNPHKQQNEGSENDDDVDYIK